MATQFESDAKLEIFKLMQAAACISTGHQQVLECVFLQFNVYKIIHLRAAGKHGGATPPAWKKRKARTHIVQIPGGSQFSPTVVSSHPHPTAKLFS